ncbi:hypothetical protein M8C21_026814 [Ambrosia artemisiifolia]|uniref:Uncharacterized protein n=1 Tax=Ambrosia artemisiifolia TaxID=4212 RepID=A0AAD5CEP3_AMBAR|nr:hypothetical protein M8C21_026814 [Ambrosia artemisiifolia]
METSMERSVASLASSTPIIRSNRSHQLNGLYWPFVDPTFKHQTGRCIIQQDKRDAFYSWRPVHTYYQSKGLIGFFHCYTSMERSVASLASSTAGLVCLCSIMIIRNLAFLQYLCEQLHNKSWKKVNAYKSSGHAAMLCRQSLKCKLSEVEKQAGNSGDVNYFAQLIDDAEGLEKIENLQSHDNNEIYEKAVKILETYWLDEEDENVADGAQTSFDFGGNNVQVPSGGFNFNS